MVAPGNEWAKLWPILDRFGGAGSGSLDFRLFSTQRGLPRTGRGQNLGGSALSLGVTVTSGLEQSGLEQIDVL